MSAMKAMKSRNWSQDEDQALIEIVTKHYNQKKITWNEISNIMLKMVKGFNKTGKQCRQRWTNQLNPDVKRNPEWTTEQNQILFEAHNKIGNKWAQISALLPGRTDNCVKNHFYSTLRKGLRKINNYIETVKRKECIVKTFKNEVLNKILLLSEGKCDEKFQFNETAKNLSLQIKKALTEIAINSDEEGGNITLKEDLFQMISEFSRNCRKKKTKKLNGNIIQSEKSENQPNNENTQNNLDEQDSQPAECINQQQIQLPKKIGSQKVEQKSIHNNSVPHIFNQSAFKLYNDIKVNKPADESSIVNRKVSRVLHKDSGGSNFSESFTGNMISNNNQNSNICRFMNKDPQVNNSQFYRSSQMIRSLFAEVAPAKNNAIINGNFKLSKSSSLNLNNSNSSVAGTNNGLKHNLPEQDWFRYSGTQNYSPFSVNSNFNSMSNGILAFVPEVEQKGFCSGTGSGFSMFRQQVSHQNIQRNQPLETVRGQINFTNYAQSFCMMPNFLGLFSQKSRNEKPLTRMMQSQQLQKSFNFSQSPLLNQFLQNQRVSSTQYQGVANDQMVSACSGKQPKLFNTESSLYESNQVYHKKWGSDKNSKNKDDCKGKEEPQKMIKQAER